MRRAALVLVVLGLAGLAAPGAADAAGWCGKGEVRGDRPDFVGGKQVRVLYVIPADGTDRFMQLAPRIAADLAAVSAWWRREDPTRAPRFDLYDFPSCPAGMGRLDIGFVRLPQLAEDFFDATLRLPALGIYLDLAGVTSAPAASFKKYLVYYDGPVEFEGVCAESSLRPLTGGAESLTGIWARADPVFHGCGTIGRGKGNFGALVPAHELVHLLGGAVPGKAPHECEGDPGHVCDSPRDALWGPSRPGRTLAGTILDVGHDDYYAHSGDWWDVQDSDWLRRLDSPDVELRVTLVNARAGDSVASDMPGIACGLVCSTAVERGTGLTLTATAGPGSRFVGWAGGCTGPSGCTVGMARSTSVSAVFKRTSFRLSVRVSGRGRVTTSAGFSCVDSCSRALAAGGAYVLRAKAARGWRFAGWRGACAGRAPCRVGLSGDRRIRAVFRRVDA